MCSTQMLKQAWIYRQKEQTLILYLTGSKSTQASNDVTL